jgi:60 kDa SS-A/Ro ribonucleoprotein
MSAFGKQKKVSAANAVPAAVTRIVNAVPDTINKAGSEAFSLTPHYQLAFLMLTSFVEDQFYRTKAQTLTELREAIKKVDPKFAAKAAIYARTECGMRSITHAAAAEIAKNVKGEQWTKNFFDKVVYRVDDASEILAAYLYLHGKPIPNSLKKGLALSLSKFDAYQLAKYKGNSDAVKLVDLFNLVHPKPDAAHAEAYQALMEGKLASTDTWESKISAAGQAGGSDSEKEALKTEAWRSLVLNKKIGYFALLRNLRNIHNTGDKELIDAACVSLTNEKLIKNSLVLPFRFLTAQKEFASINSTDSRKIVAAIDSAIEISLSNVPKFEGETLIAMDCSGSMTWTGHVQANGKPKQTPGEIGSVFCAVLAKASNADIILFDGKATYENIKLNDTVLTTAANIQAKCRGGATNFNSIFETANRKYDRVIILSDMQSWVGGYCPAAAYRAYCAKFKANPKIYCFDLQGYGTLQFPQENVYSLAGFSDKTMDLMSLLEKNPNALLQEIEKIEL